MQQLFAFLGENAALIVSVITAIAAVIGMQFKSMRYIIISQLLINGLLFLQYLLERRISAGGVVIVAFLQTVVSFFFTAKKKPFPVWLTLVFMLLFTAVSLATFSTPLDLFPLGAVLFFAIAIVQKNSAVCRVCSATNCVLWLIYDILLAPASTVTHGTILLSVIIGIIRRDRPEWKRFFTRLFGKGADGEEKKELQ